MLTLAGVDEVLVELGVRARDDVHGHELADARGRLGAGLGGRLDGADVALDDDRHEAVADLLAADDASRSRP